MLDITKIREIESTPEYRLEQAEAALEQAQRNYADALAEKCAHDEKCRDNAQLGTSGFSLIR